MTMKETWTKWCDRVCDWIRFFPDHKAVRRELEAHMEEHYQTFLADGLDEQEAEDRALACMGNADEVGRELDQVHSPMLGLLWLMSKGAVILLLAAVVVLVSGKALKNYRSFGILDSLIDAVYSGEVHQDKWDYSDGYLFELLSSEVQAGDADAGTVSVTLALQVRILMGSGLCWGVDAFYGVDSQGNRYPSILEGPGEDGRAIKMHRRGSELIYEFCFSGVPADVRWLELRYDECGRNIVFRAILTGGEGA